MDRKPLISLFSTKYLEKLPVRVQCFRLWILWFYFYIVHVPGKNLVIADTLFRAPLVALGQHDKHLKEDVQDLSVTERRHEEIQHVQENDPLCREVAWCC